MFESFGFSLLTARSFAAFRRLYNLHLLTIVAVRAARVVRAGFRTAWTCSPKNNPQLDPEDLGLRSAVCLRGYPRRFQSTTFTDRFTRVWSDLTVSTECGDDQISRYQMNCHFLI